MNTTVHDQGAPADEPSRAPLLEVQSLALSIRGEPLLEDISFSLDTGQTLGIIGESGSGKSLTALSILGLPPRGSELSGQVHFAGDDLLTLSEPAMADLRGGDIGMIFQEPMTALNPVMTIGRQVAESVSMHRRVSGREAMRIAAETLERVGLPNRDFPLSRYPHELSGGQRQRVVIAIAVACGPRLLIADEPTTALDVTTQAGILDLVEALCDSDGMALMLITHDLAVVADRADEVLIMRSGRSVEQGNRQQVFRAPSHAYTRALFEASTHRPRRQSGSDHETRSYVTDSAPSDAPSGDPPSLLEVQGLVCEYPMKRTLPFVPVPMFRAVDDVDLCIRAGESVGLVGESGCGKSTLSRALLGLASASGTIRVNGQRIDAAVRQSRELRRQVQIVFQDPYGSFNPRHKVARLVAEPLHLLDEALDRRRRLELVMDALISVGLDESDADKYIHEFSGGQRQRIAIARALITHPDLIILDEAVSALDVSVRARVLDLLAQLADQRGLAYLFISHDLSVVRHVTDRVFVMRRGKIVETGLTESVFGQPQADYTQALLDAVPILRWGEEV